MPILLAIAGVLFLALIFGPQLWIRRVMTQHGAERPDLPGSGGELARHLLDEADLSGVTVELNVISSSAVAEFLLELTDVDVLALSIAKLFESLLPV